MSSSKTQHPKIQANLAKPLAAIYVRVSTQEQVQQGFSLQAQQDALENYAKALGYEIFKLYREEGKSAKDMKRPEMTQMLADAQAGKFSAIFIYKLDRFSRSLKDLILTIDKLKEWGIDFVSLQDRIETTSASGKLMFHIVSAFAEFERNMISDRTKFTMRSKASKGGHITKAPKGYKLINKQLVIDDVESEKVKAIFHEFAETDTNLNKLAIKYNLTPPGLKKLLKNTTYLGKVKYDDEESQGTHEAIIDEDLFGKVREKL